MDNLGDVVDVEIEIDSPEFVNLIRSGNLFTPKFGIINDIRQVLNSRHSIKIKHIL